ncbi:UNVERIFIED_CONTAM: hypothetical protein PYX00_001463 [Menopon gallinae]|uniref:C2H2-type domain-containing protein n=1 Tax=Menopon gallinae TaxID=328185 RepID=A0AAW2IDM3_9NEOP
MSENITVSLAANGDGQAIRLDPNQTITLVKVEPSNGPGGETITEIQNYLETFNKEIEGGGGNPTNEGHEALSRDGNTYYVDESGQYYYTQPVVAVMSSGDAEGSANTVQAGDGQSFVTVQQPGGIVQQAGTHSGNAQAVTISGEAGNQMLINTTEGTFGTVTLMPQDTATGELSYVLIVQPSAGNEKNEVVEEQNRQLLVSSTGEEEQDQDLTVYDFDDAEEGGEMEQMESENEDDKTKIVKIIPAKKSQTVTTAHMCNYCNYTSPKRYLLSRHMKSHSEERPHKCSVCERGFKTVASLQNHVNTHTGTKPHHCKFCDSAFTTSGELVRHVRYKHTHEKPHKCTLCRYASVELSKLRNHMRFHTGERPYQCPHCTYASPDTFKLKRHLRIHTGEKPYECETCHSRFTQSNSLKAHRLIHSEADKPVFRCELCPTTCGRKTDLRIHVQKLHISDKLLKCKRCGKTLPDRYTYKVHNKTHEGEKCYRCELCPYASISARHLESHMLIHTDQKPFQCEMCDQAFRQKQLLKRHQNLYHTPDYVPPTPKEKTHECPECGRAFRHKGNLIRHLAVHDPESATHEKALALKLGRKKKIQFIDGQQVEVLTGEEEEEAMADGDVMVHGGQEYVVLQVIQLQDGEGPKQTVAVVADDASLPHNAVTLTDQDLISTQTITGDIDIPVEDEGEPEIILRNKKSNIKVEKKDTKSDMQNCFGFDDEDDMDADQDEAEVPGKETIKLVDAITN